MIKTFTTTTGTVSLYDAEDQDQFNEDHSYKNGCQLARTAGSRTLECDTHHASLYVPVVLPEI
jgi:hypothetical protein